MVTELSDIVVELLPLLHFSQLHELDVLAVHVVDSFVLELELPVQSLQLQFESDEDDEDLVDCKSRS